MAEKVADVPAVIRDDDIYIDPRNISRTIQETGFQFAKDSEDPGNSDIDKPEASFQIEETPSPISDVARRKQADLESRTYEYNVQDSDVKFNWRQVYSDVAQMHQALDELVGKIRKQECEKQQAKTRAEEELQQMKIAYNELEERLENELLELYRTLDDEMGLSNMRELELKEKEKIMETLHKTSAEENESKIRLEAELRDKETIVNDLQRTLREENVVRIGLERELRILQAIVNDLRRTLIEKNEASIRFKVDLRHKETILHVLQKTSRDETEARVRLGEELRDKERIVHELQKTSREEHERLRKRLDWDLRIKRNMQKEIQRDKAKMKRELNEVRNMCLEERLENKRLLSQSISLRQDIQTKENDIREQQRLFEEERQQNTTLEERLRNLELQMEEERNSQTSIQRELETALTAAQEALAEDQRRQQELRQELQVKENAIREQQLHLEGEHQQKTVVEERLRNVEHQMEEERNRNTSIQRELETALTAAQEALAEDQRRQQEHNVDGRIISI
ncbi:hypothetical protein ACROYT_G035389 [Oculina patagonica]